MSNLTQRLKLKTMNLIRFILFKYLHHYGWPRRLLNRMYDYDRHYNNTDLLINIGAGSYFERKGWLSADYLPGYKADTGKQHLDLNDALINMPFNEVQAYYMSHVLEHFRFEDGAKLLKSIYRSMKAGGTLRIVVPDADLILNRAKENDIEFFSPILSFFKNDDKSKITCSDHALNLLSQPRCRYSNNSEVKADVENFKDRLVSNSNNDTIKYLNDNNFVQNDRGSLHLAAYNENNLISSLKNAGFKVCYKSAFMQSKFSKMREVPIFDSTHPWLSLYVEAVK
jgi:hypothetical protein